MPISVAAVGHRDEQRDHEIRCFHSAHGEPQRPAGQRAAGHRGAARGHSGSRTGRSSRYMVMLMTTAPAASPGRPGNRGLVDQAAVAQEHDTVRPGGELRVVGDDHGGEVPALAVAVDEPHHGPRRSPVSSAPDGSSASSSDRSPPPPRGRSRRAAARRRTSDRGKCRARSPRPPASSKRLERGQVRLAHGRAVELKWQRHVLRGGEPGQQVEVLEDVADRAAAQLRLGPAGHPQRVLAVDEDGAGRRLLQGLRPIVAGEDLPDPDGPMTATIS